MNLRGYVFNDKFEKIYMILQESVNIYLPRDYIRTYLYDYRREI